jgi:hypothetical protein
LRTCCCGGFEKFELPHKLEAVPYVISYPDVVATRLSAAPGEHLHIGPLSAGMKASILETLARVEVSIERFVQLDHVDNLSEALVCQQVDLYMGSMPRGGGRATVEAMAAGLPLLLHSNYRSHFLSDENEAYPGALFWRELGELRSQLAGLNEQLLFAHSELARAFFDLQHKDLRRALDDIRDGKRTAPEPKRLLCPPNSLQALLDECHATRAKIEPLTAAIAMHGNEQPEGSDAAGESGLPGM